MSAGLNPAIVVAGYNRPQALARLLGSLRRATYATRDVPLVVSVDHGGHPAVRRIAEEFDWPWGRKQVRVHPARMGLVRQYLHCGGLTEEFGAIVYLEDDLFVGPYFYEYARAALAHSAGQEKTAGISLNALWFNGYTHQPFLPVQDGAENFYMQVLWFQGQAFDVEQWSRFAAWWRLGQTDVQPEDGLHPVFRKFPKDDWFPQGMKYLAQTGQFMLFPRVSQATNFGDAGTHFRRPTRFFQTPLGYGLPGECFQNWDDSLAVYDGFQEILPDRLCRLAANLPEAGLTVDLNATRPRQLAESEWLLTTRPTRRAARRFGLELFPPEANVIEDIPGDVISLSRVEDVDWSQRGAQQAQWRLADYAMRRQPARGWRALLRRWFNPRII